jgi:hypothetical protein
MAAFIAAAFLTGASLARVSWQSGKKQDAVQGHSNKVDEESV